MEGHFGEELKKNFNLKWLDRGFGRREEGQELVRGQVLLWRDGLALILVEEQPPQQKTSTL